MRTTTTVAAAAVFCAVVLGLASPSVAGWAEAPTPAPTGTVRPAAPIIFDPSEVVAGGEVAIFACPPDQTGTATSAVFGTVPLRQTNGYTAAGRATVPATAKPGSYRVDVRCSDGRVGRRDLRVTAASRPEEKPGPQTSRTPAGAPETGGGATAGALGGVS